MADIRLAPEQVDDNGLEAAYTGSLSTSNTYLVRNDGRTILHVKKSAAVACTVTVQTPRSVRGLAVAEQTATVDASGGDTFVGPFPPDLYNDGSDDVKFTLSNIDGVTVAVLRV